MGKLDEQFYEDRAMRDAARENLKADFAHAKKSLSGKSITGKITERIGDGAKDVFETAKEQGGDNRGVVAALLGAIILWFTRKPIFEILGLSETDEEHGGDIDYTDADDTDATVTDVADTEIADPEHLNHEAPPPKTPPSGDSDD